MISQGIDINVLSQKNETALYVSAYCGHLDIVKFLVTQKAQLIPNNEGRTALHAACLAGHLETVKFLLEKGNCDIEHLNKKTGGNLLFYAVQVNNLELIKFLIENGAKVHTMTNEFSTYPGATPLHNAIYSGNLSVVKFLVQKGANLNLPLKNGEACLTIAIKKGHKEIIKFIKEHREAEEICKQAKEKFILSDPIAKRLSKIFFNYAHPSFLSMSWHSKESRKIAADIATELEKNYNCHASLQECREIISGLVQTAKEKAAYVNPQNSNFNILEGEMLEPLLDIIEEENFALSLNENFQI